ncbi:basic salivary proline-rich protein 1-like [Falco peregrinus]|uniref:basic salivary proline-rich protein 1-like n=1 Tax=Falco peregrinus TaxID=8954 RepID=UPI0024793AFF|nr:basic salivary proline-rich protein 1-like [Falco peregrinus]
MRRDDGRKPLASPDRTSNTTQERRERGGQRRKLRKARAGAGSARSHHTHPARFGGGPGARARPGQRTEEQRRAPTAPRPAYAPASRPGTRRAAAAADGPHTRGNAPLGHRTTAARFFPAAQPRRQLGRPHTAHLRRRQNRPSPRRRRTGSGPAGRRSQPRSRDRPPGTADTTGFSPRPRPKQARATPEGDEPRTGVGVSGGAVLSPPSPRGERGPDASLPPKPPPTGGTPPPPGAAEEGGVEAAGRVQAGTVEAGGGHLPADRLDTGGRAVTAPPLGGGGLPTLGDGRSPSARRGGERARRGAQRGHGGTATRRPPTQRRRAAPPRAEETALPRRGRPLDARRAHSKDGLRPNTRRGLSARDRTAEGGRQRDTSPARLPAGGRRGTSTVWVGRGSARRVGRGGRGLGRSLSGSGLPRHGLPPYTTATAPPPRHQRRRHRRLKTTPLPPGSHRAARVFKPPPGRAAFDPRGSPREGCAETRTLGTWPWGEGNDLQGPAAVPPPLPPSGERPPAGARPTSAANTSSFLTRGAGVSLSDPALRPRGDTWLGPPARAGTRPGEGGRHASRLAHRRRGSPPPPARGSPPPSLP